jgi:DNA-binding NarL/FixJ family response regulator
VGDFSQEFNPFLGKSECYKGRNMASPSPGAPAEVGQMRIRLLVADESTMGCELLRTAFKRFPLQFEVAACEVTSEAVVRCVPESRVDVALISADLGDGRLMGLKALRELHLSHPAGRVVILFDSWQDDLIVHAFRAGAKGVLCRAEPFDRIRKCLLAVHKGQVWANSRQLQMILEALANAAPIHIVNANGLSLLTKRETQLVQLIAEGMPTREITSKLGISEHTVSNYLFRIYNKVGVSNRLELALCAIKQREDDELKTEHS